PGRACSPAFYRHERGRDPNARRRSVARLARVLADPGGLGWQRRPGPRADPHRRGGPPLPARSGPGRSGHALGCGDSGGRRQRRRRGSGPAPPDHLLRHPKPAKRRRLGGRAARFEDRVVAVVGEYHSGAVLAPRPVNTRAGIAAVFSEAWSDAITGGDPNDANLPPHPPTIFRIAPTASYAGAFLSDWLLLGLKVQKVVQVYE